MRSASILFLLALSLLCSGGSVAQDGGKALQVVLSPEGRYVRSSDTFFLRISVTARQESLLDLGVLDGSGIELFLAGEPLGTLAPKPEKKREPWKLASGTRLELRLPLDMEVILRRYGQDLRAGRTYELAVQALGDSKTRTPITVVCRPDALTMADLDLAKTQVALVTNYGTMLVSFRPDKAPKTVHNFVKLAKDGFYDGTKFHRVVEGFMIQGGCPKTKNANPMDDGSGGPGYQLQDEFSDLTHRRGVLSMANLGRPNTGGSQFFVMHANRPDLDRRYAVFGKLVEGLDTLDRIAKVPVQAQPLNRREISRPSVDVQLLRAVLLPTLK